MKRNILMSLVLVLMFGLLCGCGGSNNNDTDTTTAKKTTTHPGFKTSTTTKSNSGDKPAVTGDVTGIFIGDGNTELKTIVRAKEKFGYQLFYITDTNCYEDYVANSKVKNNKIESSLLSKPYKLSLGENYVEYDSQFLVNGKVRFTPSQGKFDGVYSTADSSAMIIIYTNPNNKVDVIYYNYMMMNYKILRSTESKTASSSLTVKGNDVTLTINKKDNSIIVDAKANDDLWILADGTYNKLEQ